MRRILALLASVALVGVAFTGTAMGARAERVSTSQTMVSCGDLVNDAGTALAFVVASEEFGSFGDVAFWATPTTPETGPPTWITASSAVMLDGSALMAEFDLVEFQEPVDPEDPPFGDPVGLATMTATLTPVGDPVSFRFQDHFGNQTQRVQGTQQELSVSGTLELPEGITYDLSGCGAERATFVTFSSNPASGIFHSSGLQLNCSWETPDGFVFLSAFASDQETFSDIFVSDASGDYFGFNAATLTTAEFAGTWDLFPADGSGELEPAGSAEASATLTLGERVNDRFTFGPFKVHVTGQSYLVDGTLSLATPAGAQELPMDASACSAGDLRVTEHFNPRQTGGKPLPNDIPDAATPIAIGETVEVSTGGTADEPEAPCLLDGEFELPLGHTAWWSFEGTGGEVTVDTAGSDFDTVLGIYIDDGAGGLTQVACVDDVFVGDVFVSLQAKVTVSTDAGVTYLIQAGGFAGQAGALVLSLH